MIVYVHVRVCACVYVLLKIVQDKGLWDKNLRRKLTITSTFK